MNIPLIDLRTQHARIESAVLERIRAVFAHGKYIMGPEVEELEEKLACAVGVRHAISCSSGTDALLMPLMAHGLGPGDAVFTTPFTFVSTAEVIALTGATPVFVDIERQSFNLDAHQLEQAIEKVESDGQLRARGIIPVDLFGLPADYTKISDIADRHDLFVIEDAAQSFGGEAFGKKVGSLAPVAATSFFPAKPLGCYGDGGAVFTSDDAMADELRSIRTHGQGASKYENRRVGLNARIDTLQAAVLLEKLGLIDEEIRERQRVAASYSERLSSLVTTPEIPAGHLSAWAQYSILSDHRDKIQKTLTHKGIASAIYYVLPLHLQEAFADLGYRKGDFPISEDVSRQIISLPMHPYLKDEQINEITTAVSEAVEAGVKSHCLSA